MPDNVIEATAEKVRPHKRPEMWVVVHRPRLSEYWSPVLFYTQWDGDDPKIRAEEWALNMNGDIIHIEGEQ